MNRFYLRWQYAYYMVNAYLADMMGDDDAAIEMLSIANEAHRLWCREQIQ